MKLEKKHYFIIGLATVAIIGVAYYNNKKKKKALSNQSKTQGGSTASSESYLEPDGESSNSGFPIMFGSKGRNVVAIQKYMNSTCPSDLKEVGVYPLEANGIWDEKTDKAAISCAVLKRNKIDEQTLNIILRDLKSANIEI